MNSILLKNNPVIGGGATGMVYAYEEDKIVKVFPLDYPIHKIESEFNGARLFNKANLPSPACYEIVSTDKGYGIVLERIEGVTLTQAISQNPTELDYFVKKMICLMRDIHNTRIDDMHLVCSAKEKYLAYLSECSRYYSLPELDSLKNLILAIPDRVTMIHGDFHTGNVMVKNDGTLMLIDFPEVCYGHPIFDIMAEGAVIPVTLENDPRLAESYLGISAELMQQIWKSYVRHYFAEVSDRDEMASITRLLSRLRNAITAAITDGIPETYLVGCADNTRSILIPRIPELVKLNWHRWD